MIPKVVLATTTWNCIDIIGGFLAHNRRIGVERVYVMDYGSDDGTREVLASDTWQPYVELMDLPSLAGQHPSPALLARIKPAHLGQWCLFCDPDEFLATPKMSVADLFGGDWQERDWISLERFNMSAPRSVAACGKLESGALRHLDLRIMRKHKRSAAEMTANEMNPPWIFTAILNKSLVRLDATLDLTAGDHVALTETPGEPGLVPSAYFLHFPIRSHHDFSAKVELYRLDHEANPGHPGWHQARWIELMRQGLLREEYLAQFIDDTELPTLLSDGALIRERRVADCWPSTPGATVATFAKSRPHGP